MFIYFEREREREIENMNRGEAERERERERGRQRIQRIRSGLCADSGEPDAGLKLKRW